MKAKLSINMHCASCSINIEKVLKKHGIQSRSNPALKICKIEFDESKIQINEIIKMIEGIGYDAKEIF